MPWTRKQTVFSHHFHIVSICKWLKYFQISIIYYLSTLTVFRRVDEARQWLDRLTSGGGCNLLKALKHLYAIKELHTACIVIGSLWVSIVVAAVLWHRLFLFGVLSRKLQVRSCQLQEPTCISLRLRLRKPNVSSLTATRLPLQTSTALTYNLLIVTSTYT